ncbi:hypothetical protein K450DRAFT_232633 [Umbelopsis ramanniana AG]|uniref:Tropomyosin n=1 Tax=Umbelopsis ramanniana AG TaxID=1314678 RepID=A0AAD5EDJ7_UMBRA|nr:uncharacterized protein K450DRAFT_232633 [Umbelopsis ramanniana AG]KAI8581352.1 hypothetical protein K450DRAFT_232633 [Umbelopsis ramanniana AG]
MNLVGLATVIFVLIRAPPSKVSVLLLLNYTIHHGQIERSKIKINISVERWCFQHPRLTLSLVCHQKLASLRAEVDSANARAEKMEAKIAELESDHNKKDDERTNLTERAKNLEEKLEEDEAQLKTTTANFQEADLKAERLQKSNHRLEIEIAELDKKIKNVEEKVQASQAEMEELTSGLDNV